MLKVKKTLVSLLLVAILVMSFTVSAYAYYGWHDVTRNNVNYRTGPSTSNSSYGHLNAVDDDQVFPTWVYNNSQFDYQLYYGDGYTWVKCWEATDIDHTGYIVKNYVAGF